jgi:hypothetical protein
MPDTPPKTYTGPELVQKVLSGLDFNAWMRTEGGSALVRKMVESQLDDEDRDENYWRKVARQMLHALWDEMLADIITPPEVIPNPNRETKPEVFTALLDAWSPLRQAQMMRDDVDTPSIERLPEEMAVWMQRYRDALSIPDPSTAYATAWASSVEQGVGRVLDENVSFDAPPVDRVDPTAVTFGPPTVDPDFDEQIADKHEIAERAEAILAEAEIGGEG